MNLITLENVSKSYSEKVLLENISLGINEGEKIGIIGVNGTGKSTLLKIIAGTEFVDNGTITKKNNIIIEFLSQNPDFDMNATVIEQVFRGNSREMQVLRQYEGLLNKKDLSQEENNKMIKLQDQINSLNLWDMEAEAKSILTRLDINDFNQKVGELSGGQRKRIALATALITPCELLILDEPTNHMDSDIIAWMEEYLNRRKGAVLMITHDRYFLDRVTNRIIEVDKGNLYSYDGNYSIFLEKKADREELEVSAQRKRDNLFRRELAWIKRGAKARSTKQKARIDRFDKLKEDMVDIKQDKLEFSSLSSRLGKKIIEIENISKSYDNKLLIKDFSYRILKDDRIGIVGENGIGKSTLMKMINSEIEADQGTISIGDTVKIGMFSQETFHMDDNMRVIDFVKEIAEFLPLANGEKISASKMLERFLFQPDIQYNFIGKLSGGEKRRLHLLRVLMGAPNVLLLDEPTNDLDTTTLSILEDFIEEFNGPVITVSHDRYFLDRICNNIFAYEGEGNIERYNGNYSDYLEIIKQFKDNNKEKVASSKKNINSCNSEVKKEDIQNTHIRKKTVKFSFNEKREYEQIDMVIEDLEKKLSDIENELRKETSDYVKINELLKQKEETEELLMEKMERWEYLNEIAEQINS
ncbi:ABC-F family ATP-binding cassette domain-containing protein [Oceanirhabdus sp. W0125-5]|uniref:ABC-F family ATP-binding cassette domain-containing protein n=1 Tax=Oceanirhabdus sp. W0125-5 TaxID=2999116 RepID=UPI0022F31DCC|nr:ABC-F family ATP-binding cassette domain-containing protein [Oceanirhabdus sp. W0125-5]WBW97852.1 ABC-F family ATP-binding cassette domain-containing protein [Oceanirhabdus sp. W0125-5]